MKSIPACVAARLCGSAVGPLEFVIFVDAGLTMLFGPLSKLMLFQDALYICSEISEHICLTQNTIEPCARKRNSYPSLGSSVKG